MSRPKETKQLTVWRHKNGKLFGVSDNSGFYINGGNIRHLIYHDKGREVVEFNKPDDEKSICGKWERVARVNMEWPDVEWENVRMTKSTYKKFMLWQSGVEVK